MSSTAKLDELSVVELRKLAQSLNLVNYSRLRKSDLVMLIETHQNTSQDVVTPDEDNLSASSEQFIVPVGVPDSVEERAAVANEVEPPTVEASPIVTAMTEDPAPVMFSAQITDVGEPYTERGPELPSLANRPVTRAMVVDPTHTHLYWQPPPGPVVHTWEVVAESGAQPVDSFRVPGFGTEGELFSPISDVKQIQVSADTGVQAIVEPPASSGPVMPEAESGRASSGEQWVELNGVAGRSTTKSVAPPISGTTTWESLHPNWKTPGGASDLVAGSRS